MNYVKGLLSEKQTVSAQLKLLGKHKDNPEVREYISRLESYEELSDYMKYLIEKYFYGNKDTPKAEKDELEKSQKVVLRII